jgi:hypothetical protein
MAEKSAVKRASKESAGTVSFRLLNETKAQLPVPTSSSTFKVNGQTYEILRYHGKTQPNLEEAIAISKGKGELLTVDEAKEITGDIKSNVAFRKALKPGEWSYVRNPKLEKQSIAARLIQYYAVGGFKVDDSCKPDDFSQVVILKKAA